MRTLIFLVLSFAAAAAHAGSPDSLPKRPGTVEEMKITDLESYIAGSDHPIIVNFWATFCVPCMTEMPYFISTVNRYKDQKVELLLVSLDLPDYYPMRITSFAYSHGIFAR